VLTHGNLSAQQQLLRDAWDLRDSDILLHILPLHHMHGLCIALLSCLGAGAGIRFQGKFDPAKTWEEMGRATVLMAVPTIYSKLLAAFDTADRQTQEKWAGNAKRLRLATSGSAALPVTLANRWKEISGSIPLERFGMTEVGVALSNPLAGERRAGSVGLPLASVLTRIVDGELWVAGPSVFLEYYRRPDATQQAFTDLDGVRYFRTGDTVTVGADGYFRILGRTSVDILKSGGYKLSALEIEEVFREHPAIAEVAIIGLPDVEWGDRVTACIVPKAGFESECTEGALRDFAKSRMAPYKIPRQFAFLSELPRNALGKVLKAELKTWVLQSKNLIDHG
jgi:malonyl-CoA/methylmalonyl-CoA synthetase